MAVTPFGAGNFVAWWPCVEWTGSNHGDILAWVRGLDPQVPSAGDAWQIGSVTSTTLTLTRPGSHPAGAATVVLAVADWLNAVLAVELPGIPRELVVRRVDKAGKWKTSDTYGRPEDSSTLTVKAQLPKLL